MRSRFSIDNFRLRHAVKVREKATVAFEQHRKRCPACRRSPFDGPLCLTGEQLHKDFTAATVRWYNLLPAY